MFARFIRPLFLATVLVVGIPTVVFGSESAPCECVMARNGDRFLVSTPSGWRYDNKTLEDRGMLMLFYPVDKPYRGRPEESSEYLWVQPTAKKLRGLKDGDEVPTVEGLMRKRNDQIQGVDPNAMGFRGISRAHFPNNPEDEVTFAKYVVPSAPLYETVAYVETDRTIFAVILAAGSLQALERNQEILWHVLKNYRTEPGSD